ncbi:MAG: DUF4350 domain-containing protein [Candidatus Latescibacterota bacterium]|nr:DUF4350 domain-containing protein [Candidatus Latescibacterota bacterium]
MKQVKRLTVPASLVGAVLLLAGGLSWLVAEEGPWLPMANFVVGALLIAISAALNADLFRHYGRWLNAFWGSIMVLAIIVMMNFLGDRYSDRIDVTEGQLHSLSDLTIQTLESLEKDVEVFAFMEGGENAELESMLEQFAVYGGGRFDFELVDPHREPQRAADYGLRTYNTLVIVADKEEHRITELNEKELTNGLLKVLRQRRERVYLTVGHGELGIQQVEQSIGRLRERLGEINYIMQDSLFLARTRQVPDDCRVLVIAGPRSPFLEVEVEVIEEYLERGGSVLALLDPLHDNGLEELLADWGLGLGPDFVIDTSGIGSLFGLDFTIPVAVTYDAEHPVTRKHQSGMMTFYEIARSVRIDSATAANRGVQVSSLVMTSGQSWAETDLTVLQGTGGGDATVSLDEADVRGPIALAAAVHDTLGGGGRLVVFGDSEFATDRYFDLQGNGDLALNAISWLAEDEALISIRPKAAGHNPIALTGDQSEWIFWISMVIYPSMVASWGFVIVSRKGRWSVRDLVAAGMGIALSLGVVALLNFIGDRYHLRYDATEDRLFTLNSATKDLLQAVEGEGKLVYVRTFMGETEGLRFQHLMDEYKYESRGFDFEVVDPQKETLLVQQYGIRERGTSVLEVTSEGKITTERFAERTEEGLSNALRRAVSAEDRTIAFVGGHGEADLTEVDGAGFSILNGRIKEMNFQIRDRVAVEQLEDVQIVAVISPNTPFSAEEVATLQDYLRRGGDLLLLVDPAVNSGLESLLSDEYSVDIGDDFVVDLSGIGQLLGVDVSVPVVIRYGEHPITSKMGSGTMTFFPLARSVSVRDGPGVDEAESLTFTDRNAWGESDLSVLQTGSSGGAVDYDGETDRPGPLSLAVALVAQADSAVGEDRTRMVVFGDSDFAKNQHFGQQSNGELLVSAVRWLAEGEGALVIPDRVPRFNPVNIVGTDGSLILWVSVFVLPFGVALSGFVIMLRRGYETYASGFASWLIYNFAAMAAYFFGIGIIGIGEGDPLGQVNLFLGIVCGWLAYGLFHRSPQAWPFAVAMSAANALLAFLPLLILDANLGVGFAVVPHETMLLVFTGIAVANTCVLVWIRRDFQPQDAEVVA